MFTRGLTGVSLAVLASVALSAAPAHAAAAQTSQTGVAAAFEPLAPCVGQEVQFWYKEGLVYGTWLAYVKNCGRYNIKRRIDVSNVEDTPCKVIGPSKTVEYGIQVHNPRSQHPVKEYPC